MTRLRTDELIEECRAIAARSEVLAAQSELSEEDIHFLRVGTKQLRACWRFARRTRPLRTALRTASRLMAHAREDAVQAKMVAKYGKDADPVTLGPTVLPDEQREEIRRIYDEQSRAWREIDAEALDAERVIAVLKKSYRRGRKRGREALAAEQPEQLHDLRKAVKRLFFQLEMAAKHGLDFSARELKRLKRLGHILGEFNDLNDLQKKTEAAELRFAKIRKREKRILREAEKLHGEIFVPKPREFTASLEQ